MICPHWEYLLTLDSDLLKISRYIHISRDNYSTYSIEFVRLLLAASSEVDVVAKILCKKIDSSREYENINDYRNSLTAKFPKFHTIVIDVPRYELEIIPWESWKDNKNPSWWTAYNDVKHHRNEHYQDANLNNTLSAIGGLYAMVWYLLKEDSHNRKRQGNTAFFSINRYIAGSVCWASGKDITPDD